MKLLTWLIASVWLINGLFCKVLNLVPRHQEIVGSILGTEFAQPLVIMIGISEVFMAIWFLSRIKSRFNAIAQISIVGLMNILEFILVPDLLLWGRFNILFAIMFMGLVYYHEFILSPKFANK